MLVSLSVVKPWWTLIFIRHKWLFSHAPLHNLLTSVISEEMLRHMKGYLGRSGLLKFFCNVLWGSSLKTPSSSLSLDRSEEALIQRRLTEEPDKRTAPFQLHPPSVEHTGQYTGLKIFYTAHNLLHFLITEYFPSPFPCLCLTPPRYILDFFF